MKSNKQPNPKGKPQVKKQKTNLASSNKPSSMTVPKMKLTSSKSSEHTMFDVDFSDDEDSKMPRNDDEDALVQLQDNDILLSMKEQFHMMKQQHNQDEKEILTTLHKTQQKQQKRKQMSTEETAMPLLSASIEANLVTCPDDDDDDADEISLPHVNPKDHFNPFYQAYLLWLKSVPKDMDRIFDPTISDERRKKLIDFLPTRSQRQYAWAIPTDEAIKIIYHFGPIIEIGAGKGYWGYLLRKYAKLLGDQCKMENPDEIYIGFDCVPSPTADENVKILNLEYQTKLQEDKRTLGQLKKQKGKSATPMRYIEDKLFPSWTHIDVGDSTQLNNPQNTHRTLFLCYPDDFEFTEKSLAYDCLKKYRGEYIITVGEFLGETRQENPFGRSADGEFQQHLCDQFHKILHITLPSWQSSHDSLMVWKRTTKVAIDSTEDDDGVIFRYIPHEEKLNLRAFASCCDDLLQSMESSPDLSTVITTPPQKQQKVLAAPTPKAATQTMKMARETSGPKKVVKKPVTKQ